MRIVLALAAALLLVGSVLATVPLSPSTSDRLEPAPPTLEWVRTRDGWQRPSEWIPPIPTSRTVSPWVAGAFIGLAAVLALVACPSPDRSES